MNMKNVQNGPELDIVPNFQPSCSSIVESLVGLVDSNHVSHSDYLFFRPNDTCDTGKTYENGQICKTCKSSKTEVIS